MSLLFNMLSRLVITFLPRSKRLLISWLPSPSTVILEPPQNTVSHCFHCFPIYLPWSDGTRCHDLSFLNVRLLKCNVYTLCGFPGASEGIVSAYSAGDRLLKYNLYTLKVTLYIHVFPWVLKDKVMWWSPEWRKNSSITTKGFFVSFCSQSPW